MYRQFQLAGGLYRSFQQGIGGDGGKGAGKPVLCGVVGIGARCLSEDDVTQPDVVGNGAGSSDAQDALHLILVVELVGVDAHGGHAHAAALHRDADTVVCAGVAVHATDFVVADGVLQKVFCDEFGTEGVAGHENRFGDVARCGGVVWGCHRKDSFLKKNGVDTFSTSCPRSVETPIIFSSGAAVPEASG